MPYRVTRRTGAWIVVSVVTGAVLCGPAGTAATATTRPALAGAIVGDRAAAVNRYDTQKLTWRSCLDPESLPGLPADYYRLECTSMLAPRDWNNPQSGADVQIRVSRLRGTRSSPEHPAPMLVTNPGGPGVEGVDLPLLLVSARRKKLLARQDVYGMDVRGTGGSSNLSCGGAGRLTIDPRRRSAAAVGLMLDSAALTARACAVAGEDLLPYVTTDQTVQDVDLLRRIAGQETVNWLGFSAGTWLGAHYASAFPDRVGQMVFDSSVEFTGTWQRIFARQPEGFQRRFEADFAPWVAHWNSVYRLGDTPQEVISAYERLRARITPDSPVDDAVALDDLVAGSLYAKALFPDTAAVLADLNDYLRADGTGRFRVADRVAAQVRARAAALAPTGLRRTFSGDADSSVFLAVTCQDTPWTMTREQLAAASAEAGRQYPLIGWSTIDQPCAFWDRSAGARAPVPTGRSASPVLIVASEHDPATPIEGAQAAAAGFAGARLLTVTDEGDHGLYAAGNTCVDSAVDDFLLKGTLPAEAATCAGTPMPEPGWGTMRLAGLPRPHTNPLLALHQIEVLTAAAHR